MLIISISAILPVGFVPIFDAYNKVKDTKLKMIDNIDQKINLEKEQLH